VQIILGLPTPYSAFIAHSTDSGGVWHVISSEWQRNRNNDSKGFYLTVLGAGAQNSKVPGNLPHIYYVSS